MLFRSPRSLTILRVQTLINMRRGQLARSHYEKLATSSPHVDGELKLLDAQIDIIEGKVLITYHLGSLALC